MYNSVCVRMSTRTYVHMPSHVQLVATPWTRQTPLWDSSGKNTGAGYHFLL